MASDIFSLNKQIEEIDFQLESYHKQAEKENAEIADWVEKTTLLETELNKNAEEKKVDD